MPKILIFLIVSALFLKCNFKEAENLKFPISIDLPQDYLEVFDSNYRSNFNHIYSSFPLDSSRYSYSKLSLGDSIFIIMTKFLSNQNLKECVSESGEKATPDYGRFYDKLGFNPIESYSLSDTLSMLSAQNWNFYTTSDFSIIEKEENWYLVSGSLDKLAVEINNDDRVIAYFKKRSFLDAPEFFLSIIRRNDYAYFLLMVGKNEFRLSQDLVKKILSFTKSSNNLEK